MLENEPHAYCSSNGTDHTGSDRRSASQSKPPGLNQSIALAQIVTLITQSVEPSSWDVNGGNGTITFEPITMSLIIKQSAEVHYQIRGSGLR